MTALGVAARKGHPASAATLLLKRASVHAVDDKGLTTLHHAARGGSVTTITMLITAGANVHARSDDELTPLHCAADGGHTAAVQLLVSHGADVNAMTRQGFTPVHFGVRSAHVEAVDALIDLGCCLKPAQRGHTVEEMAAEAYAAVPYQVVLARFGSQRGTAGEPDPLRRLVRRGGGTDTTDRIDDRRRHRCAAKA